MITTEIVIGEETAIQILLIDFCNYTLFTRPRMGPSLGFVTDVFFFIVDLCYILWSVLLHHRICNALLLEINCTIGVVLRQCFSILFEFQVIRKGCEGSGDDS